ncbi:MAG: secretin and TonB N-terminal domain-containing protein [Nitrospira sp.]|nr:secretin and TonB N-terminal domain-containing protein [Nitrospira sp.]
MTQRNSREIGGRINTSTAMGCIILLTQGFSCLAAYADVPLRLAQATDASSNAPAEFNVSPQSLTGALNEFAVATGLQVSYPANLAAGLTSPGISGIHTPTEALQILLSGTGLGFRFANSQTITLERHTVSPGGPAAAAPQSQAPPSSNDTTSRAQDDQKPVKVPEIIVKDVKLRDDGTNYVAEERTRPLAPILPCSWSLSLWGW